MSSQFTPPKRLNPSNKCAQFRPIKPQRRGEIHLRKFISLNMPDANEVLRFWIFNEVNLTWVSGVCDTQVSKCLTRRRFIRFRWNSTGECEGWSAQIDWVWRKSDEFRRKKASHLLKVKDWDSNRPSTLTEEEGNHRNKGNEEAFSSHLAAIAVSEGIKRNPTGNWYR